MRNAFFALSAVTRALQRTASRWSGASAGCFRRGDVLITLGAEWEYSFLPLLPELKIRAGIRVIGCCHDLIPIKFPQWCLPYVAEQFPVYLRQLARACDTIVCVSDTSLTELRNTLREFGEPIPKLTRIHLGCRLPSAGGGIVSEQVSSLVGKPFILFVSTIERRKNHEVLYRAFHRLAEQHGPANLPVMVFVGGRGWGVDELLHDISLDPLTQGLIRILNTVSDSELGILYQNALFCVFPSLDEGWGLPVAEALAFGKPVICSDRGALREVGTDFAEYVDPWDLPGWVHAIEGLWLDTAHREQVEERIKRLYRRPLWSETALSLIRAAQAL